MSFFSRPADVVAHKHYEHLRIGVRLKRDSVLMEILVGDKLDGLC